MKSLKLKEFRRAVAGLFWVIFLSVSAIFAASGDVDTTLNTSAYGTVANGSITVIKKQNDGKVLIGGSFTVINGVARSGLARLNADGSLDTSFDPPDFFSGFGLGTGIGAIAIQSNGKIIVGGNIFGINDVFNPGLYRLNPNGSWDSTFYGRFYFNALGSITDIEVQPDDKVIISGSFALDGSGTRSIGRLDANGIFDSSFQNPSVGTISELEIQPDGKILGGSSNALYRINNDGTTDNTFTSGTINGIEFINCRSDGKILIAGSFTTVNGFQQGRIALLNPNGSIDFNFNLNGIGTNGKISDVAVKSDGKLIIVGGFSSFNSQTRRNIAQLNADGTLDTPFLSNTTLFGLVVNDVELLDNGKILVGTNTNSTANSSLFRFNADGTNDDAYLPHISITARVRDILQQPDGKILFAGEFVNSNGQSRKGLSRVNPDGSLDLNFVPYFNSSNLGTNLTSVDIQTDGKIIVGGQQSITLARLNSDGSQDTGFNSNLTNGSQISDLAIQSDGKVLAVGSFAQTGGVGSRRIARFNSNGALDQTFAPLLPNGEVHKLGLQPDGKIIIVGDFTQIGTNLRGRIARFNSDGSLDNMFNPPGGANAAIYAVDIQSDGKIVVGGAFTSLNGNNGAQRIGRYNSDGTLDSSFIQTVNGSVLALKVQPDGKILIAGALISVGNDPKKRIARLNVNGTVDSVFNTSANNDVWVLNLQSDGKILVGGLFSKLIGLSNVGVGRLLNNSPAIKAPFDFDGDGKSDVSVFRASTNRWYEFLSSNSTVFETTFGENGDVIAPADYDGDGKTDIGFFRPSQGNFYWVSSINNTQNSIHWGAAGDIPRPSDFDGDGKVDFIVFRPSNSTWYRQSRTGTVTITTFGTSGDKPLIGDFDGDGKSDLAIYRPSTGTWWYLSSLNNAQIATQFGISTDIPVPADYDGDGKTDLAVFRPSNGTWYILNSSNGQATIVNFGLSEDNPVAADYDGDGKADIAVFRPSTGVWYLLRSGQGFTALQFGISTDIPIPNSVVQ